MPRRSSTSDASVLPMEYRPARFSPSLMAEWREYINSDSLKKRIRAWEMATRWMRWAIEEYLWISTQDAELVQLVANRPQRRILAHVMWDRFVRRVPGRYAIGPKPRRVGATTECAGIQHIDTKYTQHFPAIVLAHTAPASNMIFTWHKTFETYINAKAKADAISRGEPNKWKNHPMYIPTEKDNEGELRWKDWLGEQVGWVDEGGSYIKCFTAGNVKGAVGNAARSIHYSEVGVDDVDWDSVCMANDRMCPYTDSKGNLSVGTTIFKEGATYLDDTSKNMTATGVYLQKLIEAIHNHESSYTHIFIPWWELERYRMPLEPGEVVGDFFTGLDSRRRDREEVDNLRADMWRTWRIEKKSGEERERLENEVEAALNYRQKVLLPEVSGDIDQLHSQYPAYWKQAFVSRANYVFSGVEINDRIEKTLDRNNAEIPRAKVVSDRLVVYREPEPDVRYIVPSDHASGTAEDASTGWAFNTRDLTIDAVWWASDALTNEQAAELVELCYMYAEKRHQDNNLVTVSPALWVPEANVFGGEAIRIARDELNFSHFWRRRPIDPKKGEQERGKLGFWTSDDKRVEAIELLKDQWKTWGIWDVRILRQFAAFHHKRGSGKMEARFGHDDFMTCAWIQAYVNRVLGYVKGPDWRAFWVENANVGDQMSPDDLIDYLTAQREIARGDVERGVEGAQTRLARIEAKLNEVNLKRVREVSRREPNRAWARMMRGEGVNGRAGDRRLKGLSGRGRWRASA